VIYPVPTKTVAAVFPQNTPRLVARAENVLVTAYGSSRIGDRNAVVPVASRTSALIVSPSGSLVAVGDIDPNGAVRMDALTTTQHLVMLRFGPLNPSATRAELTAAITNAAYFFEATNLVTEYQTGGTPLDGISSLFILLEQASADARLRLLDAGLARGKRSVSSKTLQGTEQAVQLPHLMGGGLPFAEAKPGVEFGVYLAAGGPIMRNFTPLAWSASTSAAPNKKLLTPASAGQIVTALRRVDLFDAVSDMTEEALNGAGGAPYDITLEMDAEARQVNLQDLARDVADTLVWYLYREEITSEEDRACFVERSSQRMAEVLSEQMRTRPGLDLRSAVIDAAVSETAAGVASCFGSSASSSLRASTMRTNEAYLRTLVNFVVTNGGVSAYVLRGGSVAAKITFIEQFWNAPKKVVSVCEGMGNSSSLVIVVACPLNLRAAPMLASPGVRLEPLLTAFTDAAQTIDTAVPKGWRIRPYSGPGIRVNPDGQSVTTLDTGIFELTIEEPATGATAVWPIGVEIPVAVAEFQTIEEGLTGTVVFQDTLGATPPFDNTDGIRIPARDVGTWTATVGDPNIVMPPNSEDINIGLVNTGNISFKGLAPGRTWAEITHSSWGGRKARVEITVVPRQI
jgi:hypothetical protein